MPATIGLDIAKRFFQLHTVDPDTGEICKVKLRRTEMISFFANHAASIIAMEACGSSHHWGRTLSALGHDVRLIATKFVRPYVKNNKTDAADARAIWEAAQRPEMRFVAVKTEHQQAILSLHSMRDGLIKARTAQVNQIRAVFYEFGIELPEGRHWCVKSLPAAFGRLEGRIPAMVVDALQLQLGLIRDLSARVDEIERKLEAYKQSDERCQRLLKVPGVGLLTATAIVAAVGDAKEFRSGREFAAWLGLVPRQTGTGGRVRLLGISKARQLLPSGATDPLRARRCGATKAALGVARATAHDPALECCRSSAGQQDRQDGMGDACARPIVRPRLWRGGARIASNEFQCFCFTDRLRKTTYA